MKCYQFVFSPTGGTKRVADALTQSWPQPESIDLSAPDAREAVPVCEADGLALIAMPSFGGVAPRLALERLASIRGNGARCVIAAVYGNRAYEDTLVQMADYAEKAGFRVIAAVSAVAGAAVSVWAPGAGAAQAASASARARQTMRFMGQTSL